MDMVPTVDRFEKLIYAPLIVMLMAVLIAAIVDLGSSLFSSHVTASPYVREAHELIAVLGAFLISKRDTATAR